MAPGIFPFLQLATEIRLLIYKLVLPHSEYHPDSDWEKHDSPVRWHAGKCPNILFVNRQINQEATEVLYRGNVFAIYVKHPREPRLPMNDGRADPESFVLISWANSTWSNPKNPRLPFSILKCHANFQNIRRVHVSLPPLDDLLGIDVYMQKSSYAAFNGINGWIRKCSKTGNRIDDKERDRMNYIEQIKGPVDEVGKLLQTLPRIDNLYVSFQAREREIVFAEYIVQQLLLLRNVSSVHAFYVPRYVTRRQDPWIWGNPDQIFLRSFMDKIEASAVKEEDSHLPKDMDAMYWVLHSVRARQHMDLDNLPNWLGMAMPA